MRSRATNTKKIDKKSLEQRTKKFAVDVIVFVNGLPKNKVGDVVGRQLLRSGTSVGANYREANRAQSYPDFIHKISIVEKEASETQYWLDILEDLELGDTFSRPALIGECAELLAIFTSVGRTAKTRRADSTSLREDVEQYEADYTAQDTYSEGLFFEGDYSE